jgi:hypothetical protein
MQKISYAGYRFPPEIIQQAIWLYLRFTLSLRDVEDLLAERGVCVSYETVRRWVNHFGPKIAADLTGRYSSGRSPGPVFFAAIHPIATSSTIARAMPKRLKPWCTIW